MSTLAFGTYPISRQQHNLRPAQRLTDHAPTLTCDIGKNTSHAWISEPADQQVSRVVLLLQGWISPPETLAPLASELVARSEGLAAVVLEQPRLHLPHSPYRLRDHLNEANRSSVSKLRARTIEAVGKATCARFGLKELDLIAHSLGAVDAVHAAAQSAKFDVTSVTTLAGAGLLAQSEVAGVLRRAPFSRCGKTGGLARLINNIQSQSIFHTIAEAHYGLGEQITDQLEPLTARGVRLDAIDFDNDKLFGRRGHPVGFDGYTVIRDGCACHNAPGHPEEAPRIVQTIKDLQIQTAPSVDPVMF